MKTIMRNKGSIIALVAAVVFIFSVAAELAEARSRGGGRSFGGGGYSRSASKPAPRQTLPPSGLPSASPGFGGGAFTRGLAGGIAGGLIGNMLFGGMAHGTGAGGVGGTGLGLIEILLLAGIGYFLYKKFLKRPAGEAGPGQGTGFARDMSGSFRGVPFSGLPGFPNPEPARLREPEDDDPLVAGVKQIWEVDESFHPDRFKDTAQDLFFKIQAGWTRRDVNVIRDWVGDTLLAEYARHFEEMKAKHQINRLENISVRKVDVTRAGVEAGEMYVTVRFTANLLDYTVDDRSDELVGGDRENPVKFEEEWTFAKPVGGDRWKLEGIEVI